MFAKSQNCDRGNGANYPARTADVQARLKASGKQTSSRVYQPSSRRLAWAADGPRG